MNTFLGVSPQLGGGEVDADLVASARIVYLEGYLFDRPEAKAAFRQAAGIAAKSGRQVALSLSDSFCVDRHRAEFLELIRSSVDILFANEAEITSLYQTKSFDEAARHAAADTKLAALTALGEGQRHPGQRQVDCRSGRARRQGGGHHGRRRPSMRRVSCSALPPAAISRLRAASAVLAAAEIISHIGARPETITAEVGAKNEGLLG